MSNTQKRPARSGQVQRRVQQQNTILRRYLGSAEPLRSTSGGDAVKAVHAAYRAGLKAGAAEERDRICEAIKAEDDHCATGDYMLDSDDCIKAARGEWERPDYG